jgi:hypothetical protein
MTGGFTPEQRQWTFGNVLAASVVIVVLAGQAIFCLLQLAKPRPARFGWQMYSGYKNPLQYRVVRRDGTSTLVSLDRYVANPRYELDELERIVPPLICAREPDAVAVTLTFITKPTAEHRCAP